jgi:hypothetical protein
MLAIINYIRSNNITFPPQEQRFTLKRIGGRVQIVTVWLQIINQINYLQFRKQTIKTFIQKKTALQICSKARVH